MDSMDDMDDMDDTLVSGTGAVPGVVRGRARVIVGPDDQVELDDGDILVTVITSPLTFVAIIEHAAALVTDRGGLTSHPAILCRELGIPCVVGAETATTTIRDGTEIVVDGEKGTVHVAH